MVEKSFLYACDLEEEPRDRTNLTEKIDKVEQIDSHSVECASFFTIFCC